MYVYACINLYMWYICSPTYIYVHECQAGPTHSTNVGLQMYACAL